LMFTFTSLRFSYVSSCFVLVFLTYLLFTKYRYRIDIVDILKNRIDIESKLKSSHRVITIED